MFKKILIVLFSIFLIPQLTIASNDLLDAVNTGNVALIKTLLLKGANVNYKVNGKLPILGYTIHNYGTRSRATFGSGARALEGFCGWNGPRSIQRLSWKKGL
jgi:hypothetical protein